MDVVRYVRESVITPISCIAPITVNHTPTTASGTTSPNTRRPAPNDISGKSRNTPHDSLRVTKNSSMTCVSECPIMCVKRLSQ